MIKLPDNYLDSAYADNTKGLILLHFKNSADEYFSYRYYMDKAFSFSQHLERLERIVREGLTDKLAYVLHEDLQMVAVESNNQDWKPAPLIGDGIISFAQYRAHARLATAEDKQVKAGGPVDQ